MLLLEPAGPKNACQIHSQIVLMEIVVGDLTAASSTMVG